MIKGIARNLLPENLQWYDLEMCIRKINYKILVSDLDDEYQKSFLKYYGDRGDQPSTIRKRLKSLVSFVNWCNKKKYTTHKISVIPFNHNFDTEVIYLNREEVLKLYHFEKFNFQSVYSFRLEIHLLFASTFSSFLSLFCAAINHCIFFTINSSFCLCIFIYFF